MIEWDDRHETEITWERALPESVGDWSLTNTQLMALAETEAQVRQRMESAIERNARELRVHFDRPIDAVAFALRMYRQDLRALTPQEMTTIAVAARSVFRRMHREIEAGAHLHLVRSDRAATAFPNEAA